MNTIFHAKMFESILLMMDQLPNKTRITLNQIENKGLQLVKIGLNEIIII